MVATPSLSTTFMIAGSFFSSSFIDPTSTTTYLSPSATCPTLESIRTNAGDSSQGSKIVAVEAGMGVTLGVITLVVVALFVVEKQKNQRLMQENCWMTAENFLVYGTNMDQRARAGC